MPRRAIPNWGHIFSFEFWHSRTPPLTFKGIQPENSRLKTRPQGYKIKDPTPGLLAHAEVLEAAGFHVLFLVDVAQVEKVGLAQQFLYLV